MVKKPILVLTMGDPGGVGPEVLAKSIPKPDSLRDIFLLLIGCSPVFEFLEETLHLGLTLNPIPTLHPDFLRGDSINFLDVTDEAERLLRNKKIAVEKDTLFEVGRVSVQNAAMALAALKAGAYQGATGLVAGLVTAPVNKEAIRLLEPRFKGHTEYLARIARTKEFAMMFVDEVLPLSISACQPAGRLPPEGKGGKRGVLRATLVTIHVPLKRVSRLLTEEAILEKIRLTDEFLRERERIAKPKIAVTALNPHGRETGEEEAKVIEPAIQKAREAGIHVLGPVPGDTAFYEADQGAYDAVVAMYHDQALAPFKLIAFETGVNLTLGLPYVRTSPDHGTAFDIAYQGKASPRSMEAAIRCALRLIRR